MIDTELMKTKIRNIQQYLDEIRHILSLNAKDIIDNIEKLKTLERNFQLIVDEALDINIHFIKNLDLKSPDDFQSTFKILGENSILPNDFAQKIAPVVAVRNRLVHRYEVLDKQLFVENFQKHYTDFEKYMKSVDDYLEKIEKNKIKPN